MINGGINMLTANALQNNELYFVTLNGDRGQVFFTEDEIARKIGVTLEEYKEYLLDHGAEEFEEENGEGLFFKRKKDIDRVISNFVEPNMVLYELYRFPRVGSQYSWK